MTDQRFSIVIRGGTVVLPQGVARVDIGIRDETIAAIGEHLGAGITEIDAAGRIVTPGGVDPHAHIEQISGAGLLNAGSFEPHQRPLAGLRRSSRSPRNTLVSHSIALSPTITISLIGAP